MNIGLDIFSRAQRLQGGTREVRDKVPPFYVNGKWWWEKAAEDDEQGHVPLRPMAEMPDNEEDLSPEELRREQEDYKRRVRESQYIQAQQGTSNVGLGIFKNAQRLQGGTGELAQGKAPWDYFNPWGGTTKGGSNTGIPTQKFVGTAVGTATNFFVPGLGYVTGPIARWVTSMIQHGMSPQQAVQQAQQQQPEQPEAPADPAPAPPTTPTTPSAGVGIDPWGNPADPGEWWSNDFNRWNTDEFGTTPGNYNLLGPGGQFGAKGLGSSGFGGTVGNFGTAIGFGGPYGGGISAGDTSRFRGQAGFSHPYTEAQYNTSPSHFGWEGGPGYQGIQGGQPRASYEQYLEMFNAPGTAGSSTGPGGAAAGGIGAPQGGVKSSIAHTPRRAAFAMGTSDVNQGLYFYRKQLKKPKLKEQLI